MIANKYLFHLGDDGRSRRSRGGGGGGEGEAGEGVDGGGGSKYIIDKFQTILYKLLRQQVHRRRYLKWMD